MQDISNECSAPEKFSKPTSQPSDTLIVDFGSWQCRVGWSNEHEPSSTGGFTRLNILINLSLVVFDSVVHRWKDDNGVSMVKIGRGVPAGSNIRSTSRSAFENGLPVHTPTIELIFDFILKNYVEKQNISLVMTETPLIPPYCRQEITELLFEGYSCIDKVAFVLDGPAALMPTIPTALCIHVGAHFTHIYPIIEGAIDWTQVKRINWGGMVATELLLKIMGLKYPGILNSTNPFRLTSSQAQAIWHKTALVAADVASYESEMDALARSDDASTLTTLNCCIRLSGDAATESDRKHAVAEAKKAAELNQAASAEKRRILADKLRQKAEEQRAAKLRSKEHIYQALQGLIERVQVTLKKSKKIKKNSKVTEEDEDISMEFSDNDDEDVDDDNQENGNFSIQNIGDVKLFEELKRLGFKNMPSLQEGLRRAEEDYFRLSGQSDLIPITATDFTLLAVADSELSETEIREKRRLRLIKSSADARERQKAEKAAEDAKKQAAAELLEHKRATDLEGWRSDIYGKRWEIIDRLIRRQKQRADRKGAAQGSRFRSVVALGESNDDATTNNPTPADSGPDDGFGLNDDDWLVYRQVSRDDEEDSDLHDQELLSLLEGLLEERDHEEFMRRLKREQYASLTLLDRLTFGGDPEAELTDPSQPTVNINAERMRCTEGLFQPLSVQGIDQAGLPEILNNLFASYPKRVQQALAENVRVSGGPTALPGLKSRLINEISSILPEDLVAGLSVTVSTDLEGPWKGITSVESFNWITRAEYFETKPAPEDSVVEDPKNKSKKKKKVVVAPKAAAEVKIQIDVSHLNNKNCSNPY